MKLNKLAADAIVADDIAEGAKAHFRERCAALASEARKARVKRDALRMIVAPLAATYYGAEWKKRGSSWCFSSGTEGEAAKKCTNRILDEVYETSNAKKEREIPAHILKLAEALARACAKHDEKGKRGLGSAALAKAW
jgi:hypothetical protein